MREIDINSKQIFKNELVEFKNAKNIAIYNYSEEPMEITFKNVSRILPAGAENMPTGSYSIQTAGEDFFNLEIYFKFSNTGNKKGIIDYQTVKC